MPDKRAAYDRFGHAAFAQGSAGRGGGFHDPFDIFREVFGGVVGRVAEFSRRFLAAARRPIAKGASADRICVTICKSRSKKLPSAWRKRSKSASSTCATNAMARARILVRGRSTVPPAAAAARSSARADSSKFRKPVRAAGAWARSSRSRVAFVRAKDASRTRVASNLRCRPEFPTARASARPATERPASVVDPPATFTSSSTSRSTRSSNAKKIIFIAKCRSLSPSRARWRNRSADPRGQGESQGPRWNPEWPGLQAARQRHCNVNGRDRGDLLARLLVEVPSRLNSRATQETGGILRALRRRKYAAPQKLLRAGERFFR